MVCFSLASCQVSSDPTPPKPTSVNPQPAAEPFRIRREEISSVAIMGIRGMIESEEEIKTLTEFLHSAESYEGDATADDYRSLNIRFRDGSEMLLVFGGGGPIFSVGWAGKAYRIPNDQKEAFFRFVEKTENK